MGKGGSVPNAPDMSKQIGQASALSNTATSNAAQTMQTAQGYNDNAQKTLANVSGSQSGVMNAVNNTTNQNLNTYGSTFVPLQQEQAQQAQNWDSEANRQLQTGKAIADTNSAFNQQRANSTAALASEGVDPASIHGGALDAQSRVQQAAAAASAGTQADTNTQLQSQGLIAQANQLGMQVGQAGTTGAATGANIGSQIVGNTNQTNASGVNNLTAANTYLNTGVSANKSAADISNTQFQDQMAQQQAQQAQGASTLSSVGQIAGMAAMFMEKGGVVPQTGIPAPSYAGGGAVSSRGALPASPIPGSTDTKPALLTPGEFVIPHDVAAWKGHEHWYKQMDKARAEMGQRMGIPPQLSSVHTAVGH